MNDMMAKTNDEYVAPLVEVIEVEVEKGFASGGAKKQSFFDDEEEE